MTSSSGSTSWAAFLALITGQIDRHLQQEVEFVLAENRILRSQVEGRVRLDDPQRVFLAMIAKSLHRETLDRLATIVTPDTLLRWHRELVARKFDGSAKRTYPAPGRPPIDPEIVALVLKFARENPTWGYRRIVGSLKALDIELSHQTVKNILTEHGIDPAPRRTNTVSWSDFIKSHADCLLVTDFFTAEVWTALGLVTHYILFFIHVGTRKVYLAGITANPNDDWMRQVVRNLSSSGDEILGKCRYLIRDRDKKFTAGFDMIFKSIGIEAMKLPPRSPNLNAFAERFVRSIKAECTVRMIFFGEPMLRHAVTQYIENNHVERPHQGIGNVIPFPSTTEPAKPRDGPIECRERLGGLLRHYHRKHAARGRGWIFLRYGDSLSPAYFLRRCSCHLW